VNEQRPISETESARLSTFIAAAQAAAADWIGAELAVKSENAVRVDRWSDDRLTAWLPLSPLGDPSAVPSQLVVAMTEDSAKSFGERVFAELGRVPETHLLKDLVAEFANLAAGRAKALTFGTPAHFALGTPSLESPPPGDYLVAVLIGDFGEILIATAERTAD
jgi:hypothetical protein